MCSSDLLVNLYQGQRLGPIVPALYVVGMLACLLTPTWRPALIPGLTALSFYLASAATVAFVPRYHHPPDVLMHIVAAAGAVAIWGWSTSLWSTVRRARRPAPAGASAQQ